MSRYRIGATTAQVSARKETSSPDTYLVTIDDRELVICAERGPDGRWRIQMPDGTAHVASVSRDGVKRWVQASGPALMATEASGSAAGAEHAGGLEAPMPGKVFQVLVAVGDQVQAGQTLVIIEAMKMEHAIKAPYAGVVTEVAVIQDAMVEPGRPLVAISATAGDSGD